MKKPKRLKHYGEVLVTIYRKTSSYPFYRVVHKIDGNRMMKSFLQFSGEGGALEYANQQFDLLKAKNGSVKSLAGLNADKASDVMTALRHLDAHYKATGIQFSLTEAVAGYCGATKRLGGHTLPEVIDSFLNTAAIVRRKPVIDAANEFIEDRKGLSESNNGARPNHSPVYEAHVATWLREFANAFPSSAVCELTKQHIDAYFGSFKDLSAKSRNDRRAVAKMFLRWCVRKEYLDQKHRLFDAVKFDSEDVELGEIEFYRPSELRTMLDEASAEILSVIALGGLAGIRREEILRLEWQDVWRVKGKVEISARIAKGRKRRLVTICPALAAWLRPYRNATGSLWTGGNFALEEALRTVRQAANVPARRNGLRHAFVTFHYAKHVNENLTAAEAGNSPQMIHEHYRGLATKQEAAKWFGIRPAKAAKNVIAMTA